LSIPVEQVTFARRNFRVPHDSVRRRLERVGEMFLRGYHAALDDRGQEWMEMLGMQLAEVELEFRGFAYEGAAMALDLLDQLTPWKASRLSAFLSGVGEPHIYMAHVGVGWSMARLPLRFEKRLRRLDPVLRWLVLDGYGFHEGYFHWVRYADGSSRPHRLRAYGLRAFDQGLGRSLWFVGGANPEWIADAIAAFQDSRLGDLWSGVGLACAYAGGAEASQIARLRFAAKVHYPHLAQGTVFAAGARSRAGNPTDHTELACRLLCDLSADEAAALSETTWRQAHEDSEPAYEVWRRLIRSYFRRPEPFGMTKSGNLWVLDTSRGRRQEDARRS
jgi:hypothetical protein